MPEQPEQTTKPTAEGRKDETPWVPEPDFDAALIEEAAKKSALVWLSPAGLSAKAGAGRPDARNGQRGQGSQSGQGGPNGPQAVWHVWHDGAVTIVAGGAEQPLPLWAVPGRVVEVAIRSKDQGGRLISFLSQVELVAPGTPGWGAAAEALHAERLNLAEGDDYQQRWAAESAILRMRPLGGAVAPDSGSGAARPLPTPATTLGRMPKMIGGLPREQEKGREREKARGEEKARKKQKR